jgi:tetratricopeptide (TPR) repeat protein
MAPEQVAGDPNLDHRVDLYALGCMAFEMLTGKSPFAEHPPQRMLAAHLSQAPASVESLRPECPPSLALLIARLLEKDPADRMDSATEVVRSLGSVATTSSETSRLTPQGRMLRSLAVWAVATLVVWIVAKAAVVGIGLPQWTVTGALAVMFLGLPVLLFTGWAKWMARRAVAATPTLTPGGTMAVPSGTMTNIAIRANRHLSFRRATRGGIYAMVAFVVLVAGFMITRAMGIGPAASLFASGSLSAQDRIVLADFTTDARDTAMAPIVQEAVRAAMSQSNAIRLVAPTEVVAALEQMRHPDHASLDATVAREVALRTGAKAILGGRLVPAGNGYLVSLELKSADQGAMLASFQGTAAGATDLLGVVDDLTRKLRGKVGESLKSVAATVPLERATTQSLEALRLFSEATRANDIDGDYDRAVRLLREAVALDSTFALAWRKLNAAGTNARLPKAVVDSAIERAAQYADRLPPLERQLVLGGLYDQHATLGDRGRSLAAYRAAFAIDSTNTVIHNQISMLTIERGEYDTAIAYSRRQLQQGGGGQAHEKLIRSLLHAERLDEAAREVDSLELAASAPSEAFFADFERSGVEYARGNIDAAIAAALDLTESPREPVRLIGLGARSFMALAAGKLRLAKEEAVRRDSLVRTRGAPGLGGALLPVASAIVYEGNVALAVAQLDELVASAAWRAAAPVDRPYFAVAELYARGGEPARAREVLRQMERDWPEGFVAPPRQAQRALAEGEIALATDDHAQAIQRFHAAAIAPDGHLAQCDACAMSGLARAFDAAGQRDSARVYFERYLAVPAIRRFAQADPLSLAMVRRRLGELYDDIGERTKAIEQYQAFVRLWQDADPELQPAVAQVRARMAELQRQGG